MSFLFLKDRAAWVCECGYICSWQRHLEEKRLGTKSSAHGFSCSF